MTVQDRERAYKKNRYKSDPNFRMRILLRSRLYQVVKGKMSKESAEILVGCSYTELIIYIESQFKPGMCWENRKQWHLDHKVPCAKFDLTIIENQKRCFHYTNLQPLWASQNLSKAAKLTIKTNK